MTSHTNISFFDSIPNHEGQTSRNRTSHVLENLRIYTKSIFSIVSHKEFNYFQRITQDYARNIGIFPITPLLPQHRNTSQTTTNTENHTLVHTIEYLVELTLQEITQPFILIPLTTINLATSLINSEHSKR